MTKILDDRVSRIVTAPDDLGRIGLSLAADVLEHAADQATGSPFYMQSMQMVADFLRQTAVDVPEPA